jgi:hypothetical protein
MSQLRTIRGFRLILLVLLLLSMTSLPDVKQVSANPSILSWSAVDTPSLLNNVIVSPSEINYIAIGFNNTTFYAVDIPNLNTSGSNGRLYKSNDGGVTWQTELSTQLIAAGAFMPIWNLAVAPDDVNFIVAITDGTGVPAGPRQVYISTNGGASWDPAISGLSLAAGELISCVDISLTYGGTNRDVAIGTRTGTGAGRVYTMKTPSFSAWADQGLTPSDVVALKFSPAYPSDSSLVVVSSAADTEVHIGNHDTTSNFTNWDSGGYPVPLFDTSFTGIRSPNFAEIITADLELPSDFSGQDTGLRNFYASTDSTALNIQVGVYRVEGTVPHRINPPTTGRISSIAYYGAYSLGVMLAGEVTADPALGLVSIWRSSNCTANTPTWLKSDANKSPTGGGNSGYANAQIVWNQDGTRAYCGTSSADLSVGGTSMLNPGTWPLALTSSTSLDESAFSISPYTEAYEQNLNLSSQAKDADIGNAWNQLSLIDTEIDFLSDVAALDAPQTGENAATADYDVLYLFSINSALVANSFDSLWRSTSNPLGRTWERVLCLVTSDFDTILRIKQTRYEDTKRSRVIVFADLNTYLVGYSSDEGQYWTFPGLTDVTDLTLVTDEIIYVLNNTVVYKYEKRGTGWVLNNKADTGLESGHTIAAPLRNRKDEELALVGEAGPPNGLGRIAYVDFAKAIPAIGPPDVERIAPPVPGDAHVIFDDRFEENGIIYNATRDAAGTSGKIYRWVIGTSTTWDELEPPNDAFYGLVQRNDALYGAWRTPGVPEIAVYNAGVDRTLYPRANVPPPPEWDYLVAELPTNVLFTREPRSLEITSNKYNNLYAIDNNNYDYDNKVGRLWEYTDTLAKVGPFTTAPASGSFIPVDPKTGRAEEVNFAWRSLSNVFVYELQLAKDSDFTNRVLVNENITPVSQLAPEVYLPAGALIPASGSNIGSFANLESGHTYYWRVRASAAITGEMIRSPWSATMYFTVEAGLPTVSPYPTVMLFNPKYGSRNVSVTPGFSWSAMPKTTKYEFILAKDAALQQVIVKANVSTTSYLYDGTLDYNTTYFWQVRAIEPVVSDPSPVGTFTVMAQPKPTTPEAENPAPIPSWVWWIIALVTVLIAAMIAFAMVKPSYSRPGGGKLFKVETSVDKSTESILDKPKNPFAKMRDSIVMAIRRRRSLKNHADKESGNSQDNSP